MSELELFIDAIETGSVDNFDRFYKDEFREKEYNDFLPIHHACLSNNIDIVQSLIDKNCNIESEGQENRRPIHVAIRHNFGEIAEILIKYGCNIEACDKNQWRPIHFACNYGHLKVALILIENKCDIETCNMHAWRPIHFACANGHEEIVCLLLENNCNLIALTSSGQSAFDLAKEKGYHNLLNIINEEIENPQKYNKMVSYMGVKCSSNCDHQLCSLSLRMKNFMKGNLIGRGAFGEVYLCESSQTERKFALKELMETFDNKQIEETIHCYLEPHPRIIQYFGTVVEHEKVFVFMELAVGGSLQAKINDKILCQDEIVHYTKQILEGLESLHRNKIIHRDIKPENILLDAENNIKLADFNLGKILTEKDATTDCGTPNFMAPEVIEKKPYTFSADIWSLGATVINMITGKAPYYELSTPFAIMYKIGIYKTIEFPPPELMSKDLKILIETMLNSEPSQRLTALELLQFDLFRNK